MDAEGCLNLEFEYLTFEQFMNTIKKIHEEAGPLANFDLFDLKICARDVDDLELNTGG